MHQSFRKKPPARKAKGARALLSLAFIAAAGHWNAAHAFDNDRIKLTIATSLAHDDNLFRLPDGIPVSIGGKTSRSDDIATATLGAGLKMDYGMQQVEAAISHIANRYTHYSFLNFDADTYNAAWRWHLTPRVTGNLTTNRQQALVGFGDYTNYSQQNVRTTTNTRLDADWQITGGWHLRGGAEQNEYKNSQAFNQDWNSRLATGDIGIRYLYPSGSWADIVTRNGNGQYPGRILDAVNLLDTGFRERRDEINFHWPITGKSTIDGMLGNVSRKHDHFASRDYTAGTGRLAWLWQATGKLGLATSWNREASAYTDAASNYYLRDTFSVGPVWQATAKVRVSLKLDDAKRNFRGTTPHTDRLDTTQLSIDWAPVREVTVQGYLVTSNRSASIPGIDFADRTIGAALQFTF